MEIQFTKHALQRMQERAVSEDEIYELFERPFLALERKETVIIGQTDRGRFLSLIFDKKGRRLLTLWPSSRSQRKLYKERMGRL